METKDYGEHAEKASLSSDKLSTLSSLVADLDEADETVARLLGELATAKENARVIRELRIPELMDEVGLSKVVTSDGAEVSIKKIVRASIPADQREEAYGWLEEHGFGGMVKREVRVPFGKSEEAKAAALLAEIEVKFPDAHAAKSVHPQTLAAWAKKRIEEGAPLPLGLFGIFEQREAKIKRQG